MKSANAVFLPLSETTPLAANRRCLNARTPPAAIFGTQARHPVCKHPVSGYRNLPRQTGLSPGHFTATPFTMEAAVAHRLNGIFTARQDLRPATITSLDRRAKCRGQSAVVEAPG